MRTRFRDRNDATYRLEPMMPSASDRESKSPDRDMGSRDATGSSRGCLVLSRGRAAASAQAAEDRTAAVAGRVLDPLGGAIANAKVTLIRDDQPVTDASSDASGRFALASTDAGRYRVHVEAPGFASRDTDPIFVAVGEQVALDVTLTIGPLAQQVIVTATATALPESQVGASVTVLDQDVLQSLGKPDVLEALRLVPGVQVLQTGQRGGTTSLFVRGGNDDFNKVLIDGVPANDIGGSFDFGNLPVTGVDRVEVLRNPNSVLYGADALTSVVNITTRRGTSRVPELSYAIDGGNLRDAASGRVGRRRPWAPRLLCRLSPISIPATTCRTTRTATAPLPGRSAGPSVPRPIWR